MPGWGLSQRLPRLIGLPRAKELSLTGNFLSAQQAYAWGMVNRVVPKDELLPAAKALANGAVGNDADFYRGKLQAMNWFARWELPQTRVWADLLCDFDDTTWRMEAAWF